MHVGLVCLHVLEVDWRVCLTDSAWLGEYSN